jgi:hypothetical protein
MATIGKWNFIIVPKSKKEKIHKCVYIQLSGVSKGAVLNVVEY